MHFCFLLFDQIDFFYSFLWADQITYWYLWFFRVKLTFCLCSSFLRVQQSPLTVYVKYFLIQHETQRLKDVPRLGCNHRKVSIFFCCCCFYWDKTRITSFGIPGMNLLQWLFLCSESTSDLKQSDLIFTQMSGIISAGLVFGFCLVWT